MWGGGRAHAHPDFCANGGMQGCSPAEARDQQHDFCADGGAQGVGLQPSHSLYPALVRAVAATVAWGCAPPLLSTLTHQAKYSAY